MEIVIDDFDLSSLDKKYIDSALASSNWLKLELLYRSIFINTWKIRNLVWYICDVLELDPRMKFKIILIVDELNNNAIEYWSKKDDISIMRFSVKHDNNCYYLNIEAEDSWKWNEHKKASEMIELWKRKIKEWFNNHSSIRWRGLFLIIKNIVDELYFKDSKTGGLIVWINKKIK